MKWIFYFLLASNLVMLALILNTSDAKKEILVSPFEDVGDLKMVSDVELQVRANYQKQKEAENRRFALEQNDEAKRLARLRQQQELEKARELNIAICRRLGPFENKTDAESVASGLAAYRLLAKVIEEKDVRTLGYWAMLPSAGSSDEAEKLLEKLKSSGVNDIGRFPSGDMANAISLGLFSSEVNARRRARSVEELGFLPIVKAKQEKYQAHWLQFEQKPDFEFPIKEVKINYPDVEIKSCNGIALN